MGVALGCAFSLCAALVCLVWAGTAARSAALQLEENRRLATRLAAGKAELEEKRGLAEALLHEKEQMWQELRGIRETEARIRRFLGLNEQSYDEKRAHQGGMGPEESKADPLGLAAPGRDAHSPKNLTFAEFSQTLHSGLEEVVARLQDRQSEARRIPMILPVESTQAWLSCNFGWREDPVTGLGREFHNGVDIAGPWRSPILAPADGEVLQVGKDRLLGNYVKLGHGGAIRTIFGHLAAATVKAGRRIKRGEVIGFMGNSGRSTGTHLHYSVSVSGRYVDPLDYVWDRPFTTLRL
jgi:murein DD-endopeptidase MepM/ murein hydrolase activator NlpD